MGTGTPHGTLPFVSAHSKNSSGRGDSRTRLERHARSFGSCSRMGHWKTRRQSRRIFRAADERAFHRAVPWLSCDVLENVCCASHHDLCISLLREKIMDCGSVWHPHGRHPSANGIPFSCHDCCVAWHWACEAFIAQAKMDGTPCGYFHSSGRNACVPSAVGCHSHLACTDFLVVLPKSAGRLF